MDSPASVPLDGDSDGSTSGDAAGADSDADEGWQPLAMADDGAAPAVHASGSPADHVLGALPAAAAADDFDISEELRAAILGAMKGVTVEYRPAWAGDVSEDEWRSNIQGLLERRRRQRQRQEAATGGGAAAGPTPALQRN